MAEDTTFGHLWEPPARCFARVVPKSSHRFGAASLALAGVVLSCAASASALPVRAQSVTLLAVKSGPATATVGASVTYTVDVTNSFAAGAKSAPALGVTPTVTDTPARGWLLFFTWSWPADVLVMPFAINEIQLAASASPLAIPPGSSAPLGAFDCLARPITATSSFGSGFGFSADLTAASVTSIGPELNVPVYTNATPSGPAVLFDDRGATVQTPVT